MLQQLIYYKHTNGFSNKPTLSLESVCVDGFHALAQQMTDREQA